MHTTSSEAGFELLDTQSCCGTGQAGFLYLRYVLNPRQIWDWLQYYIKDREVRNCHLNPPKFDLTMMYISAQTP